MTEEERNDQWKQFGLPDQEMERAGRDELIRAFNLACLIGYPEKARLSRGYITGAFDHSMALRAAAEKGHLGILKMMQEDGFDVRAENDVALMNASCFGRLDCVEWLLAHGADPTARGAAALLLAIGNDHGRIVKALLKGRSFDKKTLWDSTWRALTNENEDVVRLLLDACSDRGAAAGEALAFSALRSGYKMIPFLLAEGADARWNGDEALMNAALAGHVGNVQLLLAAGAEPMAQQGGAFRWAEERGHGDVISLLTVAAEERKEEAKSVLIKLPQGASLEILQDTVGREDYNILALAARIGETERLLRQAVASGEHLTADVLLQGAPGRSVLDTAIDYGTWRDLFDPLLWLKQPVEMQKLWQALPEQQQQELPWGECVFRLHHQTLRAKRAPRLSRGPQP